MLNLEILRIPLIHQALSGMGPPLSSVSAFPAFLVPQASSWISQHNREGLERLGTGQPGAHTSTQPSTSPVSEGGTPRPAGGFISKCLCPHVYNMAPCGPAQPELWQDLRALVHGSELGGGGGLCKESIN